MCLLHLLLHVTFGCYVILLLWRMEVLWSVKDHLKKKYSEWSKHTTSVTFCESRNVVRWLLDKTLCRGIFPILYVWGIGSLVDS